MTTDLINFTKTPDGILINGKYIFKNLDVERLHHLIMNIEDYIPKDLINMNKLTVKSEHQRKTFSYKSFSADVNVIVKSNDIATGKIVSIRKTANILMLGSTNADVDWTIEHAGPNAATLTCKGKIQISGLMADRIESEMRRMCNNVIQKLMHQFQAQAIDILQ